MDPTITAGLVAAGVSLVVAVVTTYWQVRTKVSELTQIQFKDIVSKRIEVYPRLWSIPQTMLSDWERLRKPIDEEWARNLLASLIEWHAENGAFLSQKAYEAFHALRTEAVEVVRRCDIGQLPSLQDLQTMDLIYYDGYTDRENRRHLPLATCLKNDLGSYKVTALTVK